MIPTRAPPRSRAPARVAAHSHSASCRTRHPSGTRCAPAPARRRLRRVDRGRARHVRCHQQSGRPAPRTDPNRRQQCFGNEFDEVIAPLLPRSGGRHPDDRPRRTVPASTRPSSARPHPQTTRPRSPPMNAGARYKTYSSTSHFDGTVPRRLLHLRPSIAHHARRDRPAARRCRLGIRTGSNAASGGTRPSTTRIGSSPAAGTASAGVKLRTVSSGSSTRTVPAPTTPRRSPRGADARRARRRTGDPGARTVGSCDVTVEGQRQLQHHVGTASAPMCHIRRS